MLDKNLIENKIKLIQDNLVHLAEFKDYTFDEITSDFYKHTIVERLMEKVITFAIGLNQHIISEAIPLLEVPNKAKETFLVLADLKIYPKDFAENIAKSVHTRNVLVHQYEELDEKVFYESIKDCLIDYHKYCEYILKFIEK
jgi:uncharacterized protein YutE (UPF0331/DUF86 family)